MKKVLFTIFVICFAMACDAMPCNCILQADPTDSSMVRVVSAITKRPLSFQDVLRMKGLEGCRDIPLNRESCEEYFQQYQQSNPDALVYTSDFWVPVERTSAELLFCCLDDSMMKSFEEKVKPFLEFVKSSVSLFFRNNVIRKYFNAWKSTIDVLEKTAKDCEVFEFLHIENVHEVLNSLLLKVDEKKIAIKWRF